MKELYIFLFLPLVSFCSEMKREKTNIKDSIGFEIMEKDVHINLNKSTFELTTFLSNSSDKNFVLYAFKRTTIIASAYDSIFFNNLSGSLGGAGNAVLLLDNAGDRQRIEVDDCDDCEEADPVSHTSDFLAILRNSVKKNYLETTTILNAKSKRKVKVELGLSNMKLAKGEYQFYMIYYCGDDITEVIGEQTIKEDEKKHKALRFKGWVKSNTIKLIVE